jgi:hypothetical protein
MNPILSFSAAEAPDRLAPAASITVVAAMRIFLMGSPDTKGWTVLPMRTRPIARASGIHRSGTNTVPNAAGAVEPPVLAREIRTSTMTVARYGNADMNCEGMLKPAPCACN